MFSVLLVTMTTPLRQISFYFIMLLCSTLGHSHHIKGTLGAITLPAEKKDKSMTEARACIYIIQNKERQILVYTKDRDKSLEELGRVEECTGLGL